MEHYYTNNPTSKSEERMIEYKINEKIIKFISDNGVFSKGHVDIATNFMLNVLIKENERALSLARKNIKLNNLDNIKIVESDGFEKILEDYDVIVTNPPIRAGKAVIYKMYEDAYNHLKPNGVLYLVINKKHGAPSTKDHLTQIFGNCEVLDKKTGFNVMKCVKS